MLPLIKNGTTYQDVKFDGVDLNQLHVQEIAFQNVTFCNIDFVDTFFTYCRFLNCRFVNCTFTRCRLESDLKDVVFEETSLIGVRIWGVTGNSTQIKNIPLNSYPIAYTADSLQIGCQNYLIKEWRALTDRDILTMNGRYALKWWKEYKAFIFKLITDNPAEPTTIQRQYSK